MPKILEGHEAARLVNLMRAIMATPESSIISDNERYWMSNVVPEMRMEMRKRPTSWAGNLTHIELKTRSFRAQAHMDVQGNIQPYYCRETEDHCFTILIHSADDSGYEHDFSLLLMEYL